MMFLGIGEISDIYALTFLDVTVLLSFGIVETTEIDDYYALMIDETESIDENNRVCFNLKSNQRLVKAGLKPNQIFKIH